LKPAGPSAGGLAHSGTLREIQWSPEFAERLDGDDFSTAFARPTAPLTPTHSKRFASWTAAALRRFAFAARAKVRRFSAATVGRIPI